MTKFDYKKFRLIETVFESDELFSDWCIDPSARAMKLYKLLRKNNFNITENNGK